MNEDLLLILKDSSGVNWGVYVFHEGNEKYLYTREIDEEGELQVQIKTFSGLQKIKIGTNGQLVTYPMDDLG